MKQFDLQKLVDDTFNKFKHFPGGENASYIPYLASVPSDLAALCIVSEVKIVKATGETTIAAEKSSYTKCERCWNYWPSVGANGEYPDLCERCVSVVRSS